MTPSINTFELTTTEDIEINLILQAIYSRYGYDFRNYAPASLKRRITHFASKVKIQHLSELLPVLLHNPVFFEDLLKCLSITVTEMFRDPHVFSALRASVIPHLKTYPFVKIWHAGCATGEEVYSTAITLLEEDFLNRSNIYATDFNRDALKTGSQGIYPIQKMQQYTANYHSSGGKNSFTDYYHAHYKTAKMNSDLLKHITWSYHNLVNDNLFGEMHLVVCRNVLIYFDRDLQNKVLNLFYQSLTHRGFLCLGPKESISFYDIAEKMEPLPGKLNIYRKKTTQ